MTLNTELQQRASNTFEMKMFKLMVNTVYIMSLQNVRKQNLKLSSFCTIYTKCVAKVNFNDCVWYKKSLALLHMAKVWVVLNKPVYAGTIANNGCKVVKRYGIERIRMTYRYNNGIYYTISFRNFNHNMIQNLDVFDASSYHPNLICYDRH